MASNPVHVLVLLALGFERIGNINGDKKNGWTILGEVDNPATLANKALFGQSSSGIINISAGAQAGTSVVDLSFLLN